MYSSNLIPVKKALEIIKNTKISQKEENIPLKDANMRVLAHDIDVKINVPPFDRSAMDGYAVIAEDISNASNSQPIYLEVIEEIGAGSVSKSKLSTGKAIRIATGAPMPEGSDAVIMHEDTELNDNKIKITKSVTFNRDVALKGEDLKKGEIILKKGQILGPHHLSVIASSGYSEIKVYRKPEVAVIITGNELVEPTTQLEPGKIVNSNKFALKGLLEDSLAVPHIMHCEDDFDKMVEKLQKCIEKADVVITTGGTAISKGDVVVDAVERLGEVLVHGVGIKPGKPFGFGLINEKPVSMLSGYPVAAAVQYDIFTRNHILKMQNIQKEFNLIKCTAGDNIKSARAKCNVIRAKLEGNLVYPIRTKAGINKSIIMSNCYIIVEDEIEEIKKGEECRVIKYSSLKVCE
ncbi:MAG TPA: gephyrin-like molybdotransferase Glp [Methanobacterium sp.]|nr:gephyrin-like molybdotransferase Glp [Methanobacterium sp.]